MPPLNGLPRELEPGALEPLIQSQPGELLFVVGDKYPIPDQQEVFQWDGDSTPIALMRILKLVPHDTSAPIAFRGRRQNAVGNLDTDPSVTGPQVDFCSLTEGMNLSVLSVPKNSDANDGFDDSAQNPDLKKIFIVTRDPSPLSCARFVIGASNEYHDEDDEPLILSTTELESIFQVEFLTPFKIGGKSTYLTTRKDMREYFEQQNGSISPQSSDTAWFALSEHVTFFHNPSRETICNCALHPLFEQSESRNISGPELIGITPNSILDVLPRLPRLNSRINRAIHRKPIETIRTYITGIVIDDDPSNN